MGWLNKDMNKNDIDKILLRWFKTKNVTLRNDEDFVKKGLIDSFSLIELIIFCEKKFSIKFKEKALKSNEISTISKLSKLILNEKKQ